MAFRRLAISCLLEKEDFFNIRNPMAIGRNPSNDVCMDLLHDGMDEGVIIEI